MQFSDYFLPIDNDDYQKIVSNEPLFDSFSIFGPKNFNSDNPEVVCLYDYPHMHDTESNEFSYLAKHSKLIDQFFPNGAELQYYKFDSNSSLINQPDKVEKIFYEKNDGVIATYIYCGRLRCTPFQRPAAISRQSFFEDDYSKKFEYQYIKKDDSPIQETKFDKFLSELFIAYLKKELLAPLETVNLAKCPSCIFAYCFYSKHPYPDLYFSLIEKIIEIETKLLATAKNICEFIAPTPIGLNTGKSYFEVSSSNLFDGLETSNWPENAYFGRERFLKMLFEDVVLPCMGETIQFSIDRSINYSFEWRRPEYENNFIGIASNGLIPIFKRFSLHQFLDILKCLFVSARIYVMHTKLPSLSRVATGLQSIIYPFHFDNLSFSILPENLYDPYLYDSLGSPICGVLKNETTLRVLSNRHNILLIDLDQAEIKLPDDIFEKKIELAKYQEYFDSLKEFCEIENNRKKFSFSKKKSLSYKFDLSRIKEIVKAIMDLNQRILIDPMESVLITKHNTDENGEAGSRFNKSAYRDLFEECEKSFIDGLLDNASVLDYICSLCKKKSQMAIPDLMISHTPTFPDYQLVHQKK